jgi:hypothetical protein
MKISRTMLWTTVGTMAAGGVGLLVKAVQRQREKQFDQQLLEHEIDVLEGEGGICLS